jgi:carboxymethylenebutenolidase
MKRTIVLLGCAALLAAACFIACTGAAPSRGTAPAAVDTSRVHLGPAEGGTDAFVAWPAGTKAPPAVIVIHEWWGMNDQIRGVARRLAREGFVAIVPDLYHGKVAGDDPEMAHTLMRGLDEDLAVGDLDQAAGWVRAQTRTAKSRMGVMGFCMGGRLSELLALHDPTVAACVMYYGRPETNPTKLAGLKAPLQGHFGADDQGITPDNVRGFQGALKRAGRNAEIYEYAGAGHAFMHEGRDSYRPDAARQAWARTLAFLQKNLKR